MRKSETTNVFTEGLVMDINPIVTPNNVLCNALNATLITMNGNENALQNDMGNGRVETAYLPEGYVPLGTTQLGGIIYIVSYNPLNNRCQIGSFPSPERNISSDEISDLNQILQNSDFKWSGTSTGALVYYLKKALNDDLIFNPGDKFIVYGDTISDNFENLYNQDMYTVDGMGTAKSYTIKLDIGTITDTGKLVKFSNLKQYKIENKGTYHIFQYEGGDEGSSPDLDEYRSLVSQPYNIFSSKISGSLVLIAELVQFNDFDIQIHNTFDTSGTNKTYTPSVTFNFSGDYPFIPYGVICEVSLYKGESQQVTNTFDFIIDDATISSQIATSNTSYEIRMDDFLRGTVASKIQEIADSGYFNLGARNEQYIIRYQLTPCMNWGPLSYLTVSGQIDLDKLGTGYIEISQWRYYNESEKCNLTWGLEIYEEEGHYVDNVEMELVRFTSPNTTESVTYTINKKASYFGVFYDILPINEDYYRLSGQLKPNNLYLVKVKVAYVSEDTPDQQDIREFYRWIYTNTVFNEHYTDTDDFKDLTLDLGPSFNVDYKSESEDTETSVYGIIQKVTENLTDEQKTEARRTKTSLSAIQTQRDFSVSGELLIGLLEDYDTFYLQSTQDSFDISLLSDSFDCTSTASIMYTDREDSNQDTYLASDSLIVEQGGLEAYKIPTTSGQDVSDQLLAIPTNICEKGTFNIQSFNDNVYSLNMTYKALQMVKAYCTKISSVLSYKGRFIPLAYNRESFSSYNLEWDDSTQRWLPMTLGLFGFQEEGGDEGIAWIGGWTSSGNSENKIKVEKANDLNFHWTTDIDIANAEATSGWNGTAMFFVHRWSGDDHDCISYWKAWRGSSRYSWPTDRHSNTNRVQLALKSNNGDTYFYPINCSKVGNGSSNTATMQTSSTFSVLYNDFAQYLNNIYRYNQDQVEQSCIVPQYIYWMDDCSYSLVASLDIKSTDALNNCDVQLILDNGRINLKSVVSELIALGTLEGGVDDYPTLQSNISWTMQAVDDTFQFNISNTDSSSGIQLRNEMLDKMKVTLGTAILDYDGITILADTSMAANNTSLYMRNDSTDGSQTTYRIASATKFIPKKISYSKVTGTSDYDIVPSIQTSNLNSKEINLTRYFIIDQDGLLVLKDPKSSEFSFKRDGEKDTGTIDGYQNVCIMETYRGWG